VTVSQRILAAPLLTLGRGLTHRGGVPRRRLRIGYRWGSLVGGSLAYGGRQYRLVVFPPGTDTRERWLLRVWRWWCFSGALLATVAFGVLDGPAGLPLTLALAAALFLGPLLWLRQTLRRPRRDVAIVHAELLFGPSATADLARCRRLVSLSSILVDAERALDLGQLTPLDFQLIWGEVHAEARVMEDTRAA
jgi:hypothetical protein